MGTKRDSALFPAKKAPTEWSVPSYVNSQASEANANAWVTAPWLPLPARFECDPVDDAPEEPKLCMPRCLDLAMSYFSNGEQR